MTYVDPYQQQQQQYYTGYSSPYPAYGYETYPYQPTYQDASVFTQPEAARAPQNLGEQIFGVNKCTDGKDDGKVGFLEGVGSFFKGIGKTVANFVDTINPLSKNFNPMTALKTVGAVALAVVCPPVGVAMAVAGGVMGAKAVVNGVGAAMSATTDAEKKDALENIGSGTFQVGLSALGARAGLKAMRSTAGSSMKALAEGGKTSFFKNPVQTLKAFGKDTITGGKGTMLNGVKGVGNVMRTAGKAWTGGTNAAMPGYLATQGVNQIAANWRASGANFKPSTIAKTIGKTARNLGSKYNEAKLTRHANKDAKDYSKAKESLEKVSKEAEKLQKQIEKYTSKNKPVPEKLQAEWDSVVKAQENAMAKMGKILDKQTKGFDEALENYNKAKVANDKVKNTRPKSKDKIEAKKQAKSEFEAADKALKEQKAIASKQTTKFEAAQTRYAEYQSKLKTDNGKVEGLEKIKNPTEAQIADLKAARAKVANLKYNAPQTNILGQGLHAANKVAKDAGYGTESNALYAPLTAAASTTLSTVTTAPNNGTTYTTTQPLTYNNPNQTYGQYNGLPPIDINQLVSDGRQIRKETEMYSNGMVPAEWFG